MPRFPRLVVPDYPHHVTQRGARRQRTFFDDSDYNSYLVLVKNLKEKAGVDILAYCLMPNHVHFVVVPKEERSLAQLFGVTHHRYAKRVNAIHDWKGHLWQERFYSVVMDESHALASMRYAELNPVTAGLCQNPDDWPWSSARGNIGLETDELIDPSSLRTLIVDWRCFLAEKEAPGRVDSLRSQTRTGRPSGNDEFMDQIARKSGRRVRRRKAGRPPKK